MRYVNSTLAPTSGQAVVRGETGGANISIIVDGMDFWGRLRTKRVDLQAGA